MSAPISELIPSGVTYHHGSSSGRKLARPCAFLDFQRGGGGDVTTVHLAEGFGLGRTLEGRCVDCLVELQRQALAEGVGA